MRELSPWRVALVVVMAFTVAMPPPALAAENRPADSCEACSGCVSSLLDQLRQRGTLGMGVHIHGSKPEESFIEVLYLHEGGPADRAGVRVEDRIVRWNGEAVSRLDSEALTKVLKGLRVGERVRLRVERGGRTFDLEAQAVPMDTRQMAEALGLELMTRRGNHPQ